MPSQLGRIGKWENGKKSKSLGLTVDLRVRSSEEIAV